MKDNLEKDNYVLCPICGREKFYPEDYIIFCVNCGWEGSLDTSDIHMIEVDGLSIRDYKKIYEEYIKVNPNYIWKKDKEALNSFCESFTDYGSKCPCCGEDSLDPDYRYCYKCGWKYNFVQAQYPDFDNSSNKLSLNQYKEQYNNIIKENPNYMWKDTEEAKMPFNEKQIKWLKENNIKGFDKLTSEEELHKKFDSIEQIQKQYENKEGYEKYMFIREILNIILDNI